MEEALVLGERICRALQSTDIIVLEGRTVRITASIGLAEACAEYGTLDAVISAADTALYRAKEKGRDCMEAAASGVAQTRLDL
jgi:two-component system cell cycle response regulator